MSRRSERPLVVGFVCEGSTDVVILRGVVERLLGDVDSRTLQPLTDQFDRTVPGSAGGWSAVRSWCQRVADFREYFNPSIGDPFDAIIIALDLDIAVLAGIQKAPANLKAYDARELCRTIRSWLPSPLPGRVIIAIPVASIESWILAALFPRRRTSPQLEQNAAGVLVEKGKIPMGKTGPWKRVVEYRGFSADVARKLKSVRSLCSEADRFAKKVESVRSIL